MQESVVGTIIYILINFVFTVFGFVIVCWAANCICNRCSDNDDDNHDHDHNHDNSNDHVIITIMEGVGIKPSVLRSIPTVDFNSRDSKDGVVCVVCLSDIVDGDKAMFLPSCSHWFHADCINTWLQSHSNCPLCRKRVCSVRQVTRLELGGDESLAQNRDTSSEHPGLPTGPPPSTNAAVVEDANSGEANEVLTAATVDIPAKPIEGLPD